MKHESSRFKYLGLYHLPRAAGLGWLFRGGGEMRGGRQGSRRRNTLFFFVFPFFSFSFICLFRGARSVRERVCPPVVKKSENKRKPRERSRDRFYFSLFRFLLFVCRLESFAFPRGIVSFPTSLCPVKNRRRTAWSEFGEFREF